MIFSLQSTENHVYPTALICRGRSLGDTDTVRSAGLTSNDMLSARSIKPRQITVAITNRLPFGGRRETRMVVAGYVRLEKEEEEDKKGKKKKENEDGGSLRQGICGGC